MEYELQEGVLAFRNSWNVLWYPSPGSLFLTWGLHCFSSKSSGKRLTAPKVPDPKTPWKGSGWPSWGHVPTPGSGRIWAQGDRIAMWRGGGFQKKTQDTPASLCHWWTLLKMGRIPTSSCSPQYRGGSDISLLLSTVHGTNQKLW